MNGSFVGVGMADLLLGRTAMVTGVEEARGALKVYIGARWRGLHVLVDDAEAQTAIRRAWAHGGHCLIPLPPAGAIRRDPMNPVYPYDHALD